MARINQIYSAFTFGAIDPKLQARTDIPVYQQGCKTANNILSIPQGGFTNCWGTKYIATPTAPTQWQYINGYVMVFEDETMYQLIFTANQIEIYLEGFLVATVATTIFPGATGYGAEIIDTLGFQQVQERLIVTSRTSNYQPAQLVRSASAADAITGFDGAADTLTVTTALTNNLIYPATFAGTAVPGSTPTIYTNTIYYVKTTSTTTVEVYDTAVDAASGTNKYEITSAGTAATISVYDTWTFSLITLREYPTYDFDRVTYAASGFTFTPSATSGTFAAPLTITASSAIFNPGHQGGIFIGNNGVARMITTAGTYAAPSTTITAYTEGFYTDFTNTNAIQGVDCELRRVAFSDQTGWPRASSFFENRLYFAGTRQIPNGVFGSVTGDAYNFNDYSDDDPDLAINHAPSSGRANQILYLSANKSLLSHSNTGNFSSPLTLDTPLTPDAFNMREQNRYGAANIEPVYADDQVIVIDKASKKIIAMRWDFDQNSYTDSNISVFSEHLITDPIDMDVFIEPKNTGGFYVLIANLDGSLAILNSLYEQEIKAWTSRTTLQNVGGTTDTGYFRRVFTGGNRCWAIVERTIGAGQVFYMEELTYKGNVANTTDLFTDSSIIFADNNSATITGLTHLNGQTVDVYADGGYTFTDIVVDGGQVVLNDTVDNGYVGLRKTATFTMLPVNINAQNGPTLYENQHIREMHIHYYSTVGAKVLSTNIPVATLGEFSLTAPVSPQTGVYPFSPMKNYSGFNYDITITQEKPLPFTLIGVGYGVDI